MKKLLFVIIAVLIIYTCSEIFAGIICTIKVKLTDLDSFTKIELFNSETYDNEYRKPIINNKERTDNILIFGDSFAFGHGLSDTQNFSGKLSKYTKLNVYNRAQGGSGPQVMLYQLTSKNFIDKVKNCKTILYIYSCDPPQRAVKFRNHYFQRWVSIRYKLLKNDSLELQKISFLKAHSFIYMIIEQWLPTFLGEKYCNKLLFKIIEKSYIESKKLYPNSTFYILVFNPDSGYLPYEEEFKKMGIEIINISDLTTENFNQLRYFNSISDPHPNEAVWELITPLIVKRIGLN